MFDVYVCKKKKKRIEIEEGELHTLIPRSPYCIKL